MFLAPKPLPRAPGAFNAVIQQHGSTEPWQRKSRPPQLGSRINGNNIPCIVDLRRSRKPFPGLESPRHHHKILTFELVVRTLDTTLG